MNKNVYLDYAASTPVDKRVIKAMEPYFGVKYGNPHALHRFGQEASAAVFGARRLIAGSLGVKYNEIVFTGSATEANNLAIRGLVRGYLHSGGKSPRIVTSAIEHDSILETCRDLEKEGVEVIYIPVSKEGFVNLDKIAAAINSNTVLVSIMHANNEVGVIQPLKKIADIIKSVRGSRHYPVLHTDAVQSFQYLDCRPEIIGADLITLSAHKIYGPKGIGAIYIKNEIQEMMAPIITGSGQESGLRSGTDNVPYIVGFSKAVEISEKIKAKEAARVLKLRDYFWKSISRKLPSLKINGSMKDRLPNNLNIYFPGKKAHELQTTLDLSGIAASPGAACSTRVSKSSYILEEMGFRGERAAGSLRFTLGRDTTKNEIDYVVKIIYNLP